MISAQTALSVLRTAGIYNPNRLISLIKQTITTLHLDLRGFTVLTEAASGPYVVTPIIAALANANRVIALTRDSHFASASQVIEQTEALARLCGVSESIQIFTERQINIFAAADIITNLGFVRPIDAETIAVMKPGAVIPLMCESWELRLSDVDIDACRAKGVRVAGTDEGFSSLDIFSYSGWLCQKLLFDAQIEIHKSKITVVSSDKFGQVITSHLVRCGCNVQLISRACDLSDFQNLDALVIADYTKDNIIIGKGGELDPDVLACHAPALTIIQFAGLLAIDEIRTAGLTVYPGIPLTPRRMAVTLAGLGPRPVIELHAAGLKVGELVARETKGQSISSDPYIQLIQHIV